MNKSILIIGSKGMLGQELVKAFENAPEEYTVTAWDREEVDVTDTQALTQKVTDLWPDIIFNAVAYNAVDACEEDQVEKEKAQALNVTYPENLAKVAQSLQAILVHYSTDYVFNGERPTYGLNRRPPGCCGSGCSGCQYEGPLESLDYFLYREDDVAKPLSVYGQTKYDGEQAVAANTNNHYIIRLSKLFGQPAISADGKRSFFDVMLEKGRAGEDVKVIDGEMSKFTYAPDLAAASKALVEDEANYGIYHIINEGACTWYDAVKELYSIANIDVEVQPVPPQAFPRPAQRPESSVLRNTKRPLLRDYRDALKEYLAQ